MTLPQARELSRLSSSTFYVVIGDAVYQCWPGGRCIKYGIENMGERLYKRYLLRAKECEKRVQKLFREYEHLLHLGE